MLSSVFPIHFRWVCFACGRGLTLYLATRPLLFHEITELSFTDFSKRNCSMQSLGVFLTWNNFVEFIGCAILCFYFVFSLNFWVNSTLNILWLYDGVASSLHEKSLKTDKCLSAQKDYHILTLPYCTLIMPFRFWSFMMVQLSN